MASVSRTCRSRRVRKHAALDDAELRLPAVRQAAVAARLQVEEPLARAAAPARRQLHRTPGLVPRHRIRGALVEGHGDVGSQAGLNLRGPLGGQQVPGPVHVGAEAGALLADRAAPPQAEHLVAAAVGQQRSRPAGEAVQAAGVGNQRVARPQEQVVRVGEDDLRPQVEEVAVGDRLDRAAGADRHEGGRLHHAVRRRELPAAREPVGVAHAKLERIRHCGILTGSRAIPESSQ